MHSTSSKSMVVFQHPRTGKRGVPQQFPRRLYEMLESEFNLAMISKDHPQSIVWSASGKAFGILDSTLFTSRVLSKYFRTSKFSSFQRSLNLYGFAKVRRGPDAEMYAHPSFLRGHPEMLMQLRKCKTAAVRRHLSKGSESECSANSSINTGPARIFCRTVSPPPPTVEIATVLQDLPGIVPRVVAPMVNYIYYGTLACYGTRDSMIHTAPGLFHKSHPIIENRLALLANILAAAHV